MVYKLIVLWIIGYRLQCYRQYLYGYYYGNQYKEYKTLCIVAIIMYYTL